MKLSAALGSGWRMARWPVYIVLGLAVVYVVASVILAFQKQNDDAAVATIHAQKVTLADVQGTNLPPAPNKIENDATVAGIDKNNNGIRDDVELAIFAKYPGASNAKIRAAELQYAMTEQMFLTKVSDTATWKAVAEENFRANTCMVARGLISNQTNQVEDLVFNTTQRKDTKNKAFDFTTSVGSATGAPCDVTL